MARADYDSWTPKVTLGGLLLIHDVFVDPNDGGQAPYEIYRAALESARYLDVASEGSLRVLVRVA